MRGDGEKYREDDEDACGAAAGGAEEVGEEVGLGMIHTDYMRCL